MSLKRQRERSDGEDYDYWSLVRTVRTARGPRHEMVARLGKLDGVEQKAFREWRHLDALLEGRRIAQQLEFGEKPSMPLWRHVNLKQVRVEERRKRDSLVQRGRGTA